MQSLIPLLKTILSDHREWFLTKGNSGIFANLSEETLEDGNFNQNNFSKMISKRSKVQVLNINNQIDLKNYFKKNLVKDEVVICMGAGSISNWIREIGNDLK